MFSPYLFIFPRVSISLFTLPICFYMFSSFLLESIRILTILITVILNSLSNNPDKCIIFDLLYLFRLHFLTFGMPCHFLLKAGCCTGKRDYTKQFFSVRIYVNLLEVGLFLEFAEATAEATRLQTSLVSLLFCLCLHNFGLP